MRRHYSNNVGKAQHLSKFGFEYNMKQKLRDLKLIRDNINTKIRNRDTMLRDIMLSEPDGLSTARAKK